MAKQLAIDANLLVLLAVGQVERTWIGKHKRLRGDYAEDDFEFLTRVISGFHSIILTPNSATEAANLIEFGVVDPLRATFLAALGLILRNAKELYVKSADASLLPEFLRLGLADAAWLSILDSQSVLLTADRGLHLAAVKGGAQAYYFKDAKDKFGAGQYDTGLGRR